MTGAEAVVVRARGLIGTPFRPQGRDADGLDCIGLALAAFAIPAARVRRDYRLRDGTAEEIGAILRALGFVPGAKAEAGDLLVLEPERGRLHLAVSGGGAGGGLIHADAGLRRVVERPGPPPWRVIGCWRMGEGTG